MRAIGYLRVSSEEQAVHGCSLDAQDAQIRSYCALYHIDLVKTIIDAGQSAKSLNRQGLQQALAMLDDGSADGIVITKLDRLTRAIKDWAILIERYFSCKASLLSVEDSINTESAAGRVILNLLVSISQWERETIGERTSVALRHRQRQGIHVGAPPVGYRSENGRLIKDEVELRAVALILRFRKMMMMPYQNIAEELIRLGVPTKRGGRWHPETIRQICRRHMDEE